MDAQDPVAYLGSELAGYLRSKDFGLLLLDAFLLKKAQGYK